MSKFVDKIAGALGFSSEYDEYDEYEDEDYVEEEVPKKTVNYETNRTRYEEDRKEYDNIRPYRQKNSKVVNLHANVQMEVVVTSPETFDEAKEISQHIKDNKPAVINLEFVEQPIAQRITDFLCGCCYALNGNIQRIADKIFMIAPDNVDFAGDIDFRETLESEGGLVFPWNGED